MNNHENATAFDLADYCNVSIRSIYRDIQTLQEIGYFFISEGKSGYKLIEKPIASPYNLSANEWMAMVVFPIISGKMNSPNHPLFTAYYSGIQKIEKNVLNNKKLRTISEQIGKRLLFNEHNHKTSCPKVMSIIVESITNNKTVQVKYYSIYRNVITERKLDPYYLVPRASHLYLIAYCHYRKEIRTFRINRIQEIRLTNNVFEIPNHFCIHDFLKNRWTIIAEEKEPIHFVVRFTKDVTRYVYEYDFYTETSLLEQDDGSLILKTSVKSKIEFLRWIRSFGADAEILEPKNMREEIKKEIEQLALKYNKDIL